jgi:polyphosphate kinase
MSNESNYFNRELSWLEFNQRVLDEGRDASVPLLERFKFLAITSSNLDEFFMVRVGGLHLLAKEGITKRDAAGMTPAEQIEAICDRVRAMTRQQYATLDKLESQLSAKMIERATPATLTDSEHRFLQRYFTARVFPLISPMALDPEARELPLLRNLTLYCAIRLKPAEESMQPRFAAIPLPNAIDRFIPLAHAEGYRFILIEDLIAKFAELLFPGETIAECVPFRITRNADLSLREDYAADLLAQMEEILEARQESDCVRLEISSKASASLTGFLQKLLQIDTRSTYRLPGPIQLSDFMAISNIEGFQKLKFEPWQPQASPHVDLKASIFEVLSQKDILLCHPYDSFEPVLKLIEEAADDPDVLAIKQILYRTSKSSPIIAALKRAAEHGKYVTAVVELKARFDEARNIEWAKELEQAGVQVVYGVKGLKTHAKVVIVVRREPRGIVRYLHFGTGNYNESTARLYSDISYMTVNETLAGDASSFFNAVTGYSQPQEFVKLSAAPIRLREDFLQLINDEAERKRHGQKALIMAKMNSLVDKTIIDALYRASQAGVEILLNIRGICCLRPGVPGLSDTITVISIVDRLLEHARIYYFEHGGEQNLYISSADWMSRNLDRRVELMTPIDDPGCHQKLKGILEVYFQDTVKARHLRPDGTYVRRKPSRRIKGIRGQELLYQRSLESVRRAAQKRKTTFETHRPA